MQGDVNLIDTPNARMAPDGELSMSASFFHDTQRYDLAFQALPWLEANFLYSGLKNFDSTFPVYWDRSFALKARLFEETTYTPALAVGINDLIGTGVYSGEYLVASKQFGNFDTALGMGWGTLGETNTFRNPLTYISNSFATRLTDNAGGFSLSDFFHGPTTGLFGGISWRTPIDGLSLIAEYSSNKYTPAQIADRECCYFVPRSQINYGVSYQALDNVTLSAAWIYGRSIKASISFKLDPTTDPFPQHFQDPPLPPVHLRTPEEQQQALNMLLQQQRDGQTNTSVQTRPSLDSQNALADALWDEVGSLGDVAINGTSLMLITTSGDEQSLCTRTTTLIARYGVNIDTVLVTNATRRNNPMRCTVQKPNGGSFINAALARDAGATALAGEVAIPVTLLTIDASAPAGPSPQAAIKAIRADAAKQLIVIQAVSLSDTEAIVYYSNTGYSHESTAIERLVRVLLADAPPNIEKFRLIPTLGGEPQDEFDILRAPTERSIAQTDDFNILAGGNTLVPVPLQNPVLAAAARGTYPRYSWVVFPQFRQELFDPSNPFAVQFLAAVEGTVELLPGFSLGGEVEGNIYDNFNINRVSDSVLPHVRTDWTKYFTRGKNGIGDFEADYRFRLAPDVYAVARAGYLESMFAGVGGEVLWRPENQRWALGGDIFDVQQRNFDRLFGVQGYHVVTGHVSLYYASPWYDLNFAVHAGQYLAGDRGFTFEVTRRFSTGVELGAFFTKTNVSAAQFGEGSFDKGFIIRIPLDFAVPLSTQAVFATDIRPVQRDGGQRLDSDTILYNETRRSSYAEVSATAHEFN